MDSRKNIKRINQLIMETIATQAWNKGKVLIKGIIIAGLVLLLLIPSFYVENLVSEREQRQKEAIAEVTSKWAAKQTIAGPVLVLPYWEKTADSVQHATAEKHYAYFLPEQLKVDAIIEPLEKYRGIYKIMLYTGQINMTGNIGSIPFEELKIPEANIIWNEARLRMNITDLKGLNEEPSIKFKDSTFVFSPDVTSSDTQTESVSVFLNVKSLQDLQQAAFSAHLNLSGAENLAFTPVGKTTEVQVRSKWPHPSFTGNILPQTSRVNDSGFTTSWNSLAFKRKFPQQFKDAEKVDASDMAGSSFGVDLFVPVNAYQKTMRSVKYAVLCILLTFAAFYLIETVNQRSVHPVQYALIGLALILFYTLLLSFSEYIGFNPAYLIAALCTIGLISWFVKGVLASGRLSVILGFLLLLMYSYIFTILQLQDFALLLGSVGLFITLAVIMYFSRKMQW
jgi:inner membrane protein